MAFTLARNLIEIVLMSAGAIFIVVLITPHIQPSEIWNSIATWLRPPFIYLVVNGIIISIAATSRLCHHHHQPRPDELRRYIDRRSSRAVYVSPEAVKYDETTRSGTEEKEAVVAEDGVLVMVEENDDFVPDDVSGLAAVERPEMVEIVTSFFETQMEEPSPLPNSGRRSTPTTIALQGANPVEGGEETLESIWKKITEGRQVTRHLQKSDTGKDHSRQIASSEPSTPSYVKKSATFKERRRNISPSTKRIIREPLLSQDELNQRVEDFIRKFNQEMRLQRQRSNSAKQLINPAV